MPKYKSLSKSPPDLHPQNQDSLVEDSVMMDNDHLIKDP